MREFPKTADLTLLGTKLALQTQRATDARPRGTSPTTRGGRMLKGSASSGSSAAGSWARMTSTRARAASRTSSRA
eukprot:12081752-Alexandrium_andersonii.AAC.1